MNVVAFAKKNSTIQFVLGPKPLRRPPNDDEHGDMLTLEIAQAIVAAHDENGDGLLQWKELLVWISQGARLTEDSRDALAERSYLWMHTIRFLEAIVVASNDVLEDTTEHDSANDGWLPFMDKNNLKIIFDRHDSGENGTLDKHDMLRWMLEIIGGEGSEANAALHPTLELAERIVMAHDVNEDGVLEYHELEQWIQEGITLSPKERAR